MPCVCAGGPTHLRRRQQHQRHEAAGQLAAAHRAASQHAEPLLLRARLLEHLGDDRDALNVGGRALARRLPRLRLGLLALVGRPEVGQPQLEEAHAGGRHAVRRVLQVKEGGRRQRKLRRTAPQLRQNCARIARACSRSGFLRRLASKADAQ